MRKPFRAAVLTAALCILPAALARAEDATLTSRSGALSVSGRLIGYDGAFYRIETVWGRLTVDASAVDCAGPGCPDLLRFAPELRVAVEPWLAERVLHPLLSGYARAQGLTVQHGPQGTWELRRDDRTDLRLRLLPLSGPAEPLLAAGDADAALAVPGTGPGQDSGRLIARLPLVAVAGAGAPPDPLPVADLIAQRRGSPDWPGHPGHPLVWHVTAQGSALDRAADRLLGTLRAPSERAADPESLAAALDRDPWGLALVPAPAPPGLTDRPLVAVCGLVLDVSDFAAAAGDHPLVLPLHWMETGQRLPAAARSLTDWLGSPQATRVLEAAGIPGPSAGRSLPLADQGLRLANALANARGPEALARLQGTINRLRGGERLALSLRRDPRSGTFDAATRSALQDLANRIATGAYPGRRMLLAGFAGPGPDSAAALRQSRDDAEAALAALRAGLADTANPVPLAAEGFGDVLPLGCAETAQGRSLNRRVEVWLLPDGP